MIESPSHPLTCIDPKRIAKKNRTTFFDRNTYQIHTKRTLLMFFNTFLKITVKKNTMIEIPLYI